MTETQSTENPNQCPLCPEVVEGDAYKRLHMWKAHRIQTEQELADALALKGMQGAGGLVMCVSCCKQPCICPNKMCVPLR